MSKNGREYNRLAQKRWRAANLDRARATARRYYDAYHPPTGRPLGRPPWSKNRAVRDDFVAFCKAHPELRFWQALTCWASANVYLGDTPPSIVQDAGLDLHDAFYWEGKDH